MSDVGLGLGRRADQHYQFEIDRKIDVTAKLFLLVQNRPQTHD